MKQQRGSIMVSILVISIFLVTVLMGLTVLASANLNRSRGRIMQLQAQYSAESGADAAIATLNDSSNVSAEAYTGTSGSETVVLKNKQYRSTFKTTVANGASSKEKVITSTGYVYAPATATSPRYKRTIKVTAQRTSATTASSMLSRTIIDVASSVKNIYAKEVYVNDYVWLQKNVNVLVVENMTIAGKDATAKKMFHFWHWRAAETGHFFNSWPNKNNYKNGIQ